MVVKKTKRKASKKKASRKKVTKVSRAAATGTSSSPIEVLDGHFGEVVVTAYRKELIDLKKAARGEFRGDFTRDTFNPLDRFSRVLMQQGRVQLDADWNEQNSIVLYNLRTLSCDIGSEHWGPHEGAGFKLKKQDNDFEILPGHYYVNGILCEIGLDTNGDYFSYASQPDYPLPTGQTVEALKPSFDDDQKKALIYLDVWERHFTYLNDDSIREVALGGPDTATRAKIIWQVKVLPVSAGNVEWNHDGNHPLKIRYRSFLKEISALISPGSGRLCARVKDKKADDNDPCLVAPDSRYRGAENQLYRVEIHKTGLAEGFTENTDLENATFKWSRENSSVIFPISEIHGTEITLEHLGKDCRYGLEPNDWVEIIDDDVVLQNRSDNLLQVESVDRENRSITLKNASETVLESDITKHPYLRRWDHSDGDENGIIVSESSDNHGWLELEDGILIKFNSIDTGQDTGLGDETGDFL